LNRKQKKDSCFKNTVLPRDVKRESKGKVQSSDFIHADEVKVVNLFQPEKDKTKREQTEEISLFTISKVPKKRKYNSKNRRKNMKEKGNWILQELGVGEEEKDTKP
jgi:hypothetical protein